MFIELHALQTFPPSNLNRDDTGNPKDAFFGGVRRARISSQSAKRAIRVSDVFSTHTQAPNGTRTKLVLQELVKALVEAGKPESDARKHAEGVLTQLYAKMDAKNPEKTSVILFLAEDERRAIVDIMLKRWDELGEGKYKALETELKPFFGQTSAPDIALFGRMLAKNPRLNLDAACQMAHAISTHEANTEFDYFTAVDDWQPDDNSGTGMLGLVAFNSATYYRCARIDWGQLVHNLRGDADIARQTVKAFMLAFALVVPSAMKNSFVNQHMPDFLLAVVRPNNDGQSLANAFEQPVRARGKGYAEPSVLALTEYWEATETIFRLNQPHVAVLNPRQYELKSAELTQAVQPNLETWVGSVVDVLG